MPRGQHLTQTEGTLRMALDAKGRYRSDAKALASCVLKRLPGMMPIYMVCPKEPSIEHADKVALGTYYYASSLGGGATSLHRVQGE